MPAGLGYFDLLCDFATEKNFGVPGLLWVALKVVGANRFAAEVPKIQKELRKQFAKVLEQDGSIGGVLLLVASVEQLQGAAWGTPALTASLYASDAAGWRPLSGGIQRVSRGQAKTAKPPLPEVWKKMSWVQAARGTGEVGLFNHFLAALGLPKSSAGKRAKTLNKALKKVGQQGRIIKVKLVSRASSPCWAASKDVFRCLYKLP